MKPNYFYSKALFNATNEDKVLIYVGLSNLAANSQDALELLDKALKIDGNNALVLANRATIYLEQGDIEKAISEFKEIILYRSI